MKTKYRGGHELYDELCGIFYGLEGSRGQAEYLVYRYRYKEVRRFGGKIREFQPKWSMSMI